jgi:hypothetical protein
MNARRSATRLAVAVVVLAQVTTAPFAHAASTTTNAPVSTLSASRQFAAYANDQVLPSALCVYAERIKREWLRRMNANDNWRDPILLVVHARETAQENAPPISMIMFQTDEHLKYQIYCLVPPRIDEAELLSAIVEVLCSEWANREQVTVRGKAYTAPVMPAWLVQGLGASIQGRYEFLLSIVQRSVAAGRPPQATDLLGVKALPVDTMERQLFQANAWIFTESLLALPDGSRKFRRFLSELGGQKVASNAFWAVYQQNFPQETALEKWWSLEQARRTSVTLAQNLSVDETVRQLDSILPTTLGPASGRGGIPDEMEVPIDKLWQYADAPWLKDVLKLKIDRLGALRSQAHPLYQSVLDKYIEAVTWLYRGSATRFRFGLNRANVARTAAEKQSTRIAAYMDQAERSYAPGELSKVFTGYFQTLDRFQKLDDDRRSPISDYLDKFDR